MKFKALASMGAKDKSNPTRSEIAHSIFMTRFVRDATDDIVTRLYSNPSLMTSASAMFVRLDLNNILNSLFENSITEYNLRSDNPNSLAFSSANLDYVGGYGDFSISRVYGDAEKSIDRAGAKATRDPEYRAALAPLLNLLVGSNPSSLGHLKWVSISVSDVVPILARVLYKIERLLISLLESVDDMVKYLVEIIRNLQKKIKLIEDLIKVLLIILEIANLNISYAVLSTTVDNSTNAELANTIINATGKPSELEGYNPQGYSVGAVFVGSWPSLDENPFGQLLSLFGSNS
jgi:hypothetical protein